MFIENGKNIERLRRKFRDEERMNREQLDGVRTSEVSEIDRTCLDIVKKLYDKCHALEPAVGLVSNIVNVFFHDLIIHFTGIIIHRQSVGSYGEYLLFPVVNKRYALSPYTINQEGLIGHIFPRSIKSTIRNLQIVPVAIGHAIPYGYKQHRFLSKLINLLGRYQPFEAVYLPRMKEQRNILSELVFELCHIYEIPNSSCVEKNWLRYVDRHVTDAQPVIRQKGAIVGTRNNLENRKLSINFLQQGKSVVGVTHGEVANSVIDEPPFGYSERSLCSTLVDYGDFDVDGVYNTPLVKPEKKIYRSSPVISRIHRIDDSIKLGDLSASRLLYVPTTYSGNDLYGPFHTYEGEVYKRWQRELINSIPEITIKIHPKSREKYGLKSLEARGWLEDCIEEYDILIFDYFGSGTALAVNMVKPVIYFDIGLRKFNPRFKKDLIDRCAYVTIDLEGNIGHQIREGLGKYETANTVWSNAGISKYSLCDDEAFDWLSTMYGLFK